MPVQFSQSWAETRIGLEADERTGESQLRISPEPSTVENLTKTGVTSPSAKYAALVIPVAVEDTGDYDG
jgi:hypothetical protein